MNLSGERYSYNVLDCTTRWSDLLNAVRWGPELCPYYDGSWFGLLDWIGLATLGLSAVAALTALGWQLWKFVWGKGRPFHGA